MVKDAVAGNNRRPSVRLKGQRAPRVDDRQGVERAVAKNARQRQQRPAQQRWPAELLLLQRHPNNDRREYRANRAVNKNYVHTLN